jgi:hypothetical protein
MHTVQALEFQMFKDSLRIFSFDKLNLSFTETDAEMCVRINVDRQFEMFLDKYSPLIMQDLSFKRY